MAPGRSARDGTRDALTAAGHGARAAQREQVDELTAALRVLRQAEIAHDRTVAGAERGVAGAQRSLPLTRLGRRLVLYEDRLVTHDTEHELTESVTAAVQGADQAGRAGHLLRKTLVIEGPGWTETVRARPGQEARLRRLAEQIEAAARDAGAARERRRAEVQAAEARLAAARADRQDVQEARSLIHRLDDLLAESEQVLDLAPGVWSGHDGVLVATDLRLLFVAWRKTFSVPYADISDAGARGRRFGARLTVSTTTGKLVIAGLTPVRADELVDLVRARTGLLSRK